MNEESLVEKFKKITTKKKVRITIVHDKERVATSSINNCCKRQITWSR
jgi:hypothetical protein